MQKRFMSKIDQKEFRKQYEEEKEKTFKANANVKFICLKRINPNGCSKILDDAFYKMKEMYPEYYSALGIEFKIMTFNKKVNHVPNRE